MTKKPESFDKLIDSLEERVKELNCLYEIEEILSRTGNGVNEALTQIVKEIPDGFQYTEICRAKLCTEMMNIIRMIFRNRYGVSAPTFPYSKK